jgi:hypothetical protein
MGEIETRARERCRHGCGKKKKKEESAVFNPDGWLDPELKRYFWFRLEPPTGINNDSLL